MEEDTGDVDGTRMGIVYGSHGDELRCGGGPSIVEAGGGSRLEITPEGAVIIRVPAEAVDELVGATGEGVLGREMNWIGIAVCLSAQYNRATDLDSPSVDEHSNACCCGCGYFNVVSRQTSSD